MERNNMLIYKSFYEAISELKKQNQAEIWQAVFQLGLYGKEVELNGINKTIFTLIKPQIEANIKRYQNGKKPKISKPEASEKQNKSKLVTNNNNNNNKNKNIKERKEAFRIYLIDFNKSYPAQLIQDFFDYWTEHGLNDKKMRFEKEKTFGVARRLATWQKRTKTDYSNQKDDKLVSFINSQLNKNNG